MATLSKLQKLPEISKNYKNPNFRTDFGTKINQIFKLKFVFTRLSILMVILSNNLRKSGAPLGLFLTVVQTESIFEIIVGKSRIRHRTTLDFE